MTKGTENWIEQVKTCGQSIIDNAEQIVSDYKYNTELEIIARIVPGCAPRVTVKSEHIPEEWMESQKRNGLVTPND